MTYERTIRRKLKAWAEMWGFEFCAAQWVQFSDEQGVSFAQPDAWIECKDMVLLFECKLTQSDGAEMQAMSLYAPLLEELLGKPVVGCQVFKNIRYRTGRMVESVEELLGKSGYWLWHNLG